MKLKLSVLATLMFGLLLAAFYYVHILYVKVDVVFYAAITDGVLAALVAGILLASLPFFKALSKLEKGQLIVIWLLAGYAFAISVPTVVDRSLSFYILEKLQQRGGGITQASFPDVFTKEYMPEHRLVDVRLTEQVESGTIVIENGCVRLTEKGQMLASTSRFYRQHLLPKKRLLMGEYTDDLTNPFRHSIPSPDYQCK